MRVRTCFAWAFSIALAASSLGCSLVFSGNEFRGTRADGGTDGATDTGVDATPPGPRIDQMALSSYIPIVGQRLRLDVIATSSDGSAPMIERSWTRIRPGATDMVVGTDTELELTPGDWQDGDAISIVTVPVEATGLMRRGEPRTLGPYRVLTGTSGSYFWRPIAPSLPAGAAIPTAWHDPKNERLLWWSDGILWELPVWLATPNMMWRPIQVPAAGAPTFTQLSSTFYDATRERLYVLVPSRFLAPGQPGPITTLYWLDLSMRGLETWHNTMIRGTSMPSVGAPHVFVEPSTGRVYVYGGIRGGTMDNIMASVELYELTGVVGNTFDPAWRLHTVSGGPQRVGMAVIVDQPRNRALFIGGLASGPRTEDIINAFDFATASFSRLGVQLPASRGAAGAAIAPGTNRAYIAGGVTFGSGSAQPALAVLELDLEADTIATLPDIPFAASTTVAVPTPRNGGGIITASGDFNTGQLDVNSFARTSRAWATLHSGSTFEPRPRTMALGWSDGGLLLYGGQLANGNPTNDVWNFDLAAQSWSRIEGMEPDTRFGVVAVAAYQPAFTGGRGAGGNPNGEIMDGRVYRRPALARTFAGGIEPSSGARPGGNVGSVQWGCPIAEGEQIRVFGGKAFDRAMSVAVNSVSSFPLMGSSRVWSDVPVTGLPPAGRMFPAATKVTFGLEPALVLFGGVNLSAPNPFDDVYFMVNPCLSTPTWHRPSVSSAQGPSARQQGAFASVSTLRSTDVFLFGGERDETTAFDDIWRLDVGATASATISWERIRPPMDGPSPIGRRSPVWVAFSQPLGTYDATIILFGGAPGVGEPLGDTWALHRLR